MAVTARNWLIFVVYLVLFAVAVPWYWRLLGLDPVLPLTLGVPRWFALSVFVSLLISIFTAVVIIRWWPASLSGNDE